LDFVSPVVGETDVDFVRMEGHPSVH